MMQGGRSCFVFLSSLFCSFKNPFLLLKIVMETRLQELVRIMLARLMADMQSLGSSTTTTTSVSSLLKTFAECEEARVILQVVPFLSLCLYPFVPTIFSLFYKKTFAGCEEARVILSTGCAFLNSLFVLLCFKSCSSFIRRPLRDERKRE